MEHEANQRTIISIAPKSFLTYFDFQRTVAAVGTANGDPSANRCNALGKFTLTDYCVELFTLLKCRKKRECFAVG
jgi:hypothetical protein